MAWLAAANYMNAGLDPALQALVTARPAEFLSQTSAITELDDTASDTVLTLGTQVTAAVRAAQTAEQQIATVTALETQMNAKKAQIDAEISQVNSAVMAQAMRIYTTTGMYPQLSLPTESTAGAAALRAAMTRIGDPYVWGAAGPRQFDCSGLVAWAFAQEGIGLPHYTGSLWNSGVHVARSDLEPGDLVFFYKDISHVGMVVANGLMVDAPDFGETVRVQPIDWSIYVGAVRIG